MTDRLTVLGIPIDRVSRKEAVMRILEFSRGERQYMVATPNPEMIVAAQHDRDFQDVLSFSSLNLPDGAGLLWAARMLGSSLPERVTGTDVMHDVCLDASCPAVFLLGAEEGVAAALGEKLHAWNPSLVIAGSYAGSPLATEEEAIVTRINESEARILFVAYGAPAQEKWIHRNLPKMPQVRVAMGVGGAFDFLSGRVKRAPAFFRDFSAEWLWRLMLQPWRWHRIYTAVIVFPRLVRRSLKSG